MVYACVDVDVYLAPTASTAILDTVDTAVTDFTDPADASPTPPPVRTVPPDRLFDFFSCLFLLLVPMPTPGSGPFYLTSRLELQMSGTPLRRIAP